MLGQNDLNSTNLLERLNEEGELLHEAMKASDGKAVRDTLRRIAEIQVDAEFGEAEELAGMQSTHNNLLRVINKLQAVILDLSLIVTDEEHKPTKQQRTWYPRPLSFKKRWNSRPPKSLEKRLAEASSIRAQIQEILNKKPKVSKTSVVDEIVLKNKITNQRAHNLVEGVMKAHTSKTSKPSEG